MKGRYCGSSFNHIDVMHEYTTFVIAVLSSYRLVVLSLGMATNVRVMLAQRHFAPTHIRI